MTTPQPPQFPSSPPPATPPAGVPVRQGSWFSWVQKHSSSGLSGALVHGALSIVVAGLSTQGPVGFIAGTVLNSAAGALLQSSAAAQNPQAPTGIFSGLVKNLLGRL